MTKPIKFGIILPVFILLLLAAPAALGTSDRTQTGNASQATALNLATEAPTSADPDIGYLSVANAPAEHERQEAARLEAERAEAERLEAERARQAARTPRASTSSTAFDMPSECTGKPIPAHIVMRESRCNYGAVNQTGCSGYTCVGMYQFDLRHWIAKEDGGWGGCAHYGDWRIPENQDACAAQMSRGGTYLAPWGG